MLYLKTNEENEVIFFHKQPFHEQYGLGKTEEELKEEGFFVDYLKELPRPEDRDGFLSKTFFDGEKFWFIYVASEETLEEQYIREMKVLNDKHENERKKNLLDEEERKRLESKLNESIVNVQEIADENNENKELTLLSLSDSAMLIMEMMNKEEELEAQQSEVASQKEHLLTVGISLTEEKEKIQLATDGLLTTTSDTAMMTMQMMDMEFTIESHKEVCDAGQEELSLAKSEIEILVQKNKEISEELLQAKEQMVTTNNELTLAKEALELAQEDIAGIILQMLEGGSL